MGHIQNHFILCKDFKYFSFEHIFYNYMIFMITVLGNLCTSEKLSAAVKVFHTLKYFLFKGGKKYVWY